MSKEMTVKEAITNIEGMKEDALNKFEESMSDYDIEKEDIDRIKNYYDDIITLLKRGDAYEKMWKEVFANYKVAETDNHYSDNKTKNKIKLKLEQKYLKEAKDE